MKLNRETLLHQTFQVGILLKGIDGALETLGAALVWLLDPSSAERMLRALFRHELAANPHAFIATYLIGASRRLAASRGFAAAFLLSHGLTKVVLVVALWLGRLWAYPLMIFVLAAFIVYQIERFAHTHSVVLALLTVFDLLIVWLTWREYGELRRHRSLQGSRH